jgi:hypothetical protein
MSAGQERGGRLRTARAGLGALALVLGGAADPPPEYVGLDTAGRLVYTADRQGHHVPDFSHCGYRGGGVPIPDATVRVVVPPTRGDNTAAIQAAIDHVAHPPADARGLRGAVLLLAGRHEVGGGLRIGTSGVVLRGQGDGPDGTVLVATGTGRRALIKLAGKNVERNETENACTMADSYVPIGTNRLRLDRDGHWSVGEAVVVEHPSTAAWIASLGMDRFPPGEAGFWLKWQPGTLNVRFERVITAVEGVTVMLDVPLPMPFDASLGRGRVYRASRPGRIAEVGVENLRCVSEFDRSNPRDEQHAWDAVVLDDAEDAWVRQVTVEHFAGSAVHLGDGSNRVTVEECVSREPVSELGGYRRHTFFTSGQRTLFERCRAEQGRHDFAVGALAVGPNAFVRCEARAALGFSGPIESWATGVLYDNVTIDGAGLSLTNRESEGQGVGWAADGSALWQCTAAVITCRSPPGGRNWAIGCWGQFLGDGGWQAPNEFVKPESLYHAQLAQRLGRSVEASARHAIPCVPGGAPVIGAITRSSADDLMPSAKPVSLSGGWLVRDGSLLTGGRVGTVWWRGSLLPERARGFGLGITRFVPGRDGPGYTDDLDALSDSMVASGKAALEHHWGLWYDRRRDNHQMVRRPDGDVWPPFYEQPWARSGRGAAWDGLSRYELTRFNPWYFDRLDRFAGLCDQKGLVLFHEAYFQHNILEAGAHWADFPWRPANCLQETGFPEPPPYVNKKRVFMADAFYDVSHPIRRELHRLYIRKCLDCLGNNRNVIYLTGEEFTGPLEFMRFWLDTVTAWERETGKRVLIGLGATKDVQDAILADPARGPAVSAIELKYWWYAPDGSLYAPDGGKNLAPRQQLREWKGAKGRSDEQTARQIREYRVRYPEKAILCADPAANPWFVLAAGGSMPNLPRSTDRRLLAALPRMAPFGPDGRQWALADPGRDYLVVSSSAGPIELDLLASHARLSAHRIDPRSGQAVGSSTPVEGGKLVQLPVTCAATEAFPVVLWLTRAETHRQDTPR